MLIRHGEKHTHGNHDKGITADGRPSSHELTVRGWQRASALVGLFAPGDALPTTSPIQTPRSIFASDATKDSPSKRAMHTARPLADALGMKINHHYAEEEEEELAAVILKAPSPVLIVWHHGKIPRLARMIGGDHLKIPDHWPDDRFDVTWLLECSNPHKKDWHFSQHPQRILTGDRSDVF